MGIYKIEIVILILPILLLIAFFYLVYRIIDNWVEKSNSLKREQNSLLNEIKKLIENKH